MFKPMLAATADNENLGALRFPLLASPKLDGFRALVVGGVLVSRNLKPIRNLHTQGTFGYLELTGLDGELIVGRPTDPDCFNTTSSGVTTVAGEPEATFHVFDHWNSPLVFSARHAHAGKTISRFRGRKHLRISLVPHDLIENEEQLLKYEQEMLALGYEGVMLRSPGGPYKHGRSTLREGHLIKLKRFVDGEAVILECVEQLSNQNVATRDALGRTERSSHKAGKVAKGTLGAFRVRELKTGVEFDIGTGMDDKQRAVYWAGRATMPGKIIKYKSFPTGTKDKPRFPVILGFRDETDL